MYNLTVSEELKSRCPEYRGAAVYAEVTNTPQRRPCGRK